MSKTLTDSTKKELLIRAGGRCECTMKICNHNGRCNSKLIPQWHAHQLTAGDGYILSNLKAMCPECHRNTPSYGKGKA